MRYKFNYQTQIIKLLMSNFNNQQAAPESNEEEIAAAVPVRRNKRRNCMVIPGTSDPLIAKLYSDALMK